MDPRTEMIELLREIERVLPDVTWKDADPGATAQARVTDPSIAMYTGTAGDWFFVVTSFDIEPQGFPKGSRGWDGVGRKGTTIIRLTRELAEQTFKLAEANHG